MTESADSPRTGLILGFLIGGALLVGLSMYASWARGRADAGVPAVEIVTRDTTVANPVRLVIRTDAPLELTPMGWTANQMHLHVIVDSLELMPGARDIEHVAADTFTWTLPPIRTGTHNVRLFWSDARHAAIGDTTVARLTVH